MAGVKHPLLSLILAEVRIVRGSSIGQKVCVDERM